MLEQVATQLSTVLLLVSESINCKNHYSTSTHLLCRLSMLPVHLKFQLGLFTLLKGVGIILLINGADIYHVGTLILYIIWIYFVIHHIVISLHIMWVCYF